MCRVFTADDAEGKILPNTAELPVEKGKKLRVVFEFDSSILSDEKIESLTQRFRENSEI